MRALIGWLVLTVQVFATRTFDRRTLDRRRRCAAAAPVSAPDMERSTVIETLVGEPEGFFDILEERRQGSDLRHAFRTFNPQPYQGLKPTSAAELNKMVLDSQYLKYIIQEVMAETGEPREVVLEEASSIVWEMSQNLQLGFIRLLGFTLSKVFKSVFRSIYVNEEGLARLQNVIPEYPVILMPNHRSYIDFLILSYIMFTYDLSIPVIAAGIPLMGMKLVGEILRRSGAFFIRRAIGSDKLYWAVLSEYVRTIVRTGHAPLEFYVEGLRSRTLKSLPPKLGMMHMVLEPFFKGEVFDISLVPISISYERVLEESLLAHELLGVPKPAETTGALLKARSVLKEDFGSMHVCFGLPVSVRGLVNGKISRRQYNLIPRDLPIVPNKETQECVSDLAHTIIRLQERNVVLSPWNLIATVLLQNLPAIDLDLLTSKTLRLKRTALQFGAHLTWPRHFSHSEVLLSSLALHKSVVRCERGHVCLVEEEGPGPLSQEQEICRRATALLICASYRNQALHIFSRPAMVLIAMTMAASHKKHDVFRHFHFLLEIFANEFVFVPGQAVLDFEEGCSLLQQCGVIKRSGTDLYVQDEAHETVVFLRAIMQPFIESYKVVFRYMCEECPQTFREKTYLPRIRTFIMKLVILGEVESYESLSSDVQKNVLSALIRIRDVTRSKVDGQNEFTVNKAAVKKRWDVLSGVSGLQMSSEARL